MMSSPPPRHGHDVIGRLVIEPIPPRRIITPRCLPPSVPFPFHVPIAPRLACFAPAIRPIARCHHAIPSVRCFLIISASSSRHHACGSCPPRLTPRPCLSMNGEGLRAGCGLFRCRRLACFPNAVATPRAIWSAPISPRHLVRSCCFACADGGCVRCREVASTASPLERFNRFLKCCRINLLKLYGSSAWLCSTDTGGGVSNPVASSFHPPFRLGVVGLTACVPCVAACQSLTPLSVPAASRFSPRPHDTMSGAVSAGRPAACPTGRRTGRAVSSLLSCVHSAAYPMRSSDRPPPCRSFASPTLARSVSSLCFRSPVFIMLAIHYRHASLHGRRGAGRGERLLGGADRMICVGLKKAGVVFVPRPLASVLSSVDALIVIAHVSLLTDNIAIRSAWTNVRCLVARLKITSHAEAAFPAFDI